MASYEETMLKLEKMAQQNTAQGQQWQERMSNTSHQREVKDLVAAGLNPVLSSGGSGAASYTTQVDSAVSGIAGMASARESANATRFAAKQSAAATRAAAAAQIAAAREAAAASRYAADRHYEATAYQVDHTKTGAALNIIDKTINSDAFKKITQSIVNVLSKNNPEYRIRTNMEYSRGNLNRSGHVFLNNSFDKIPKIPQTRKNETIFIDAFLNHKKEAMYKWAALMNSYYKNNNNSAARYKNTNLFYY